MSQKTIWKYVLRPEMTEAMMPKGAKVLSAGLDPAGEVCVWAEVDPDAPKEPRKLIIVGTGHNVPPEAVKFIGTVFMQPMFMWHVYEGPQ